MSDPMTRLNAALEDRYRIERELGEGGMATVYLAEDIRHNRKVALKVLKPELAAVVGAERFLSEIETTARLQHPNILPLFDSGEADSFLFYVMPHVVGESLRDRLEREKQLPVDEAVRTAVEVAEALHSAHEQGVVHRDIKPANILISHGRPLVADFGIALALSAAGGHRLTETGLSVGSPNYMSPEQATGDQVVGPSSDLYSLGCVLYEMLVGEPPYTGSTAQAILGKVITSDPDSVTSQRRAVPLHVDAVVARVLEKVPADRFASGDDFARALEDEHFRHGGAAGGMLTSVAMRPWIAGGWVVAAVAIGALLISFLSPDPALPVRTLSLAFPDEYGPSEWLELTPDGSALILSDLPRGRGGMHSLVVHRLDDLARVMVPGSEGGFDPAVSRDGETVAFGTLHGLYVAPVSGGSVRTLVEEGAIWSPRWGSDGYIYYAYAPDFDTSLIQSSIFRVLATGGAPELVLEPAPGSQEILAYYQPLPGGDRAIVWAFPVGGSPQIEILDTNSGQREVLTEGVHPFIMEGGYLVFAREGGRIFAALLDAGSMSLASSPVLLVEGVGMVSEPPEAAMFTLSESGDLAYWVQQAEARDVSELMWVDRAGGATPVDPAWRENLESVSISPNGTRAAVTIGSVGDTEIWVKELDDGPARRLTNYPGMNRRPVWSPDGASLAFISDRGGPRAVYAVPVDGIATPELLLEHPDEDVDEVLWSPEGDWLIYRTGTTPDNRDIYARRLSPDTATIAVAARPGIDERAPALSPDGRWLAYVSNETGEDEVWVRLFPDVDRGSRQVSVGGAVEPVWSESGNELFFRASGEGLTAVEVGEGEDFSIGEMNSLFRSRPYLLFSSHRAYDLDRGRNRFAMIRAARAEAEPALLILVQNFMEEVKARVGR